MLRPLESFLALFWSRETPETTQKWCEWLAVSCQESLNSGGFLTSNFTCDPCKSTNTVSEMEIEPSCVGIGQKLNSVDQKTTTTMVMEFPTLWLGILRIFTQTDTWLLCCRNFSQTVCWSNFQSDTPFRPLYHLITNFWGVSVEWPHFGLFLM